MMITLQIEKKNTQFMSSKGHDLHKQNEEQARQVDDGIGGMGNGIMITAAKHANMTGNNKISLRNGKISSRW